MAVAALALFGLGCAREPLEVPEPPAPNFRRGTATHYDARGRGACSLEKRTTRVAAVGRAEYAASGACGTCLEVEGRNGRVVVTVVDRCAACKAGHLDLSPDAFEAIDDLDVGRTDIGYRVVPCPVEGPIAYRFEQGSDATFTALQILRHRVPVAGVRVLRDGAMVSLERRRDNHFVLRGGVGAQPDGLTIEVTATDGQVVRETLATFTGGTVVQGTVQFE